MNLREMIRRIRLLSAGKKRYGAIYAVAVLILFGGLWAAKEAGSRTDVRMRSGLSREIRNIAATISPEEVRTLSFSADDTGRPGFRRLSNQLRAYAEAAGLRSLYTMALRDGDLVFGPESLLPDDPYASPPGTVYREPSDQDFEIFRTGAASVQGPSADEYGLFVTATAPVFDPQTGQVLMTVGLDEEASAWKSEVRKAQWLHFLAAMIPLIVLGAGYTAMKLRRNQSLHVEPLTCAATLLLLTLGVAFLIHDTEKKSREDIFQALAQTQTSLYMDAFKDIRNGLALLTRFFESSEHISREEFRSFCEPLLQETPIIACVWLPKVPAPDVTGFEEQTRKNGLREFSIRSRHENSPAEVLYPMLYLEPATPIHDKITGFDLYSGGTPARAAIDEALLTGRASASEPMPLYTCPGEPLGIFIFKPVSTAQMNGLAGMVLHPESLLATPHRSPVLKPTGLSVSLFELTPGQVPSPLARTAPDCTGNYWQTHRNKLFKSVPIFAFGKTYGLLISPGQPWLETHPLHSGKTALLTGFLLSALLTALTAILVNRPALLEKMVQQRTEELHESELRFNELAIQSHTILWEVDANGLYTYVNRVVKNLLGYRPEELIGKMHYYDLHLEEGREKFRQTTFALAERKEKFIHLENPIRARDGKIIWASTNGVPLLDQNGNLTGYSGSDTDITTRRQAEQNLREQKERLRTTLNSIGDAVISTDTKGLTVGMNPIAEELTGWSLEEATGKPLEKIFRIINEHTRSPVESPFVKVIREGMIIGLANHTLLIAKDGRETPIADSGAPIRNERGEITGVVLVFRDQTQERENQKALQESEARYRLLFENMSNGFALHEMIYDDRGRPADYRFLSVNPAFERMTGLQADRITGRTVKEVLPGTEDYWIERYGKVVKTGAAAEFEEYSGVMDRWFDIRAFCPAPDCFAVVFTDITGQKKSEAELKEKLDELNRFNRSAVGRELRMVELKQTINRLSKELGRPEPYPVTHGDLPNHS